MLFNKAMCIIEQYTVNRLNNLFIQGKPWQTITFVYISFKKVSLFLFLLSVMFSIVFYVLLVSFAISCCVIIGHSFKRETNFKSSCGLPLCHMYSEENIKRLS